MDIAWPLRSFGRVLLVLITLSDWTPALLACAKDEQSSSPDPGTMAMPMSQAGQDPAGFLMKMASGTSMNPDSGQFPMIMSSYGRWTWMWMAQGFAVDTHETGPRGRDKFYSVNWGMIASEHRLGKGEFLFQSMLSLEPLTVTDRRYPELFQTGETAYGVPLVDAQHPHNFIMALGAQYARPLGEGMIQLYYAPVGDPALGPVAFPHRASAEDLPEAPLGHHWEDSTHIAGDVATVAFREKCFRIEASGFYGTEPGENRWALVWGPMNSWSSRASFAPSSNWSLQISAGRLTHPERQVPGDLVRMTASVQYSLPLRGRRTWSSALIWGRDHDIGVDHRNLNAYLGETVLPVGKMSSITARAEVVAKDDLFADSPATEQELAVSTGTVFQVRALTTGYTRSFHPVRDIEPALGANLTVYDVPGAIQPYYGHHPAGVNLYFRLRITDR